MHVMHELILVGLKRDVCSLLYELLVETHTIRTCYIQYATTIRQICKVPIHMT